MTRVFKKVILALVFFTFKAYTYSAVPESINYQGILTDTSGRAVSGSKTVVFKIYESEQDATAIWSQTEVVNIDSNGFYSVELDVSGLDFNVPYWLGINVEGTGEMSPRYKISSAGYAVNSNRLNGKTAAYYLDHANHLNVPLPGSAAIAVYESPTKISSPTAKIVFNTSNFNCTESPASVANISVTTAPYALSAGEIAKGTITAITYKLSRSATGYITVPACSFSVLAGSTNSFLLDNGMELRNTASDFSAVEFAAPIGKLPEKAKIIQLAMIYYRNDPEAVIELKMHRYQMFPAYGANDEIAAVTGDSTAASADIKYDDSITAGTEVVENAKYSYVLSLTMDACDSVTDIRFYGARIAYTYDEIYQ